MPSIPILSTYTDKGIKIAFLDFDMTLLLCADKMEDAVKELNIDIENYDKDDEASKNTIKDKFTTFLQIEKHFETYKQCLKDRQANKMPGMNLLQDQKIMYKKSLKYYHEILLRLNRLKSANLDQLKNLDWKVVRVHQSIFNIERDFLGLKKNKQLMQAFKEAGINLWLASHHHSAQILLGRYEGNYEVKKGISTTDYDYKYLVTDDPKFRFELTEPIIQSISIMNQAQDIIYDKSENYFFTKFGENNAGADVEKKKCDRISKEENVKTQEKKFVTTINRCNRMNTCTSQTTGDKTTTTTIRHTMKIDPKNTDYIIQLITGNGGRMLDPLLSDLESDSFLLFGRAYPQEFGYYTLELKKENNKNSAIVTYKFGNSNSKNKINYFLTLEQENGYKFDNNFKIPSHFMNYLKDKYKKFEYAKDKYCLKKY